MLANDLLAAVESGGLGVDDTNLMDILRFCKVCLNNNYIMSRCKQVKTIAKFIQTRDENFYYWWNPKESKNIKLYSNTTISGSTVGITVRISLIHNTVAKVWLRHLAPATVTVTIMAVMSTRHGFLRIIPVQIRKQDPNGRSLRCKPQTGWGTKTCAKAQRKTAAPNDERNLLKTAYKNAVSEY